MNQLDMFAPTTASIAVEKPDLPTLGAAIGCAKEEVPGAHRPDRWWPSNDPSRQVAVCLGCSIAFHRVPGSDQLEYLNSYREGYQPAGPCVPLRRYGALRHKEGGYV